jgi:hypothetical protein
MQMQSMPERIAYLEARLGAVCRWLEINQPDVFSRGMWDAVEAATNAGNTSLCWHCSKPQGYFSNPCGCGAINPNVDLKSALAQQSAPVESFERRDRLNDREWEEGKE